MRRFNPKPDSSAADPAGKRRPAKLWTGAGVPQVAPHLVWKCFEVSAAPRSQGYGSDKDFAPPTGLEA